MARRRKPLNWFDKLFLGFLCVCVVGGFALQIGMGIAEENERIESEKLQTNFSDIMETYLEDGSLVTGNKAVCLESKSRNEENAVYTMDHVPENYIAEEPEEVRYLIHYTSGSSRVGQYSGGGGAYQKWAEVSVEDLKTGEIMGQTKIFGDPPPMTIVVKHGGSGSGSGSAPGEEEVKTWVLNVLEGKITEQTAHTEQTESGMTEEVEVPETTVSEGNRKALKIAENLLAGKRGFSPETLREWLMENESCTAEEAAYAVENCSADWADQALATARHKLGTKNYGYGPLSLEQTLQKDGFTPAQITYALDNCNPDWKEQALKLAIYHAEDTGWSYSNMYRSLMKVYGFSEEEARYGADNCNADWNEAAADHVRIFLKYSDEPYTREQMIQEMIERFGFTEEQAVYGVDKNGLK